jgi:CheY-like chemotaxis protein
MPVIALTANVFDDMRRRCMEVGMNAFVGKPVNLPELFPPSRTVHSPRDSGLNPNPQVKPPCPAAGVCKRGSLKPAQPGGCRS